MPPAKRATLRSRGAAAFREAGYRLPYLFLGLECAFLCGSNAGSAALFDVPAGGVLMPTYGLGHRTERRAWRLDCNRRRSHAASH